MKSMKYTLTLSLLLILASCVPKGEVAPISTTGVSLTNKKQMQIVSPDADAFDAGLLVGESFSFSCDVTGLQNVSVNSVNFYFVSGQSYYLGVDSTPPYSVNAAIPLFSSSGHSLKCVASLSNGEMIEASKMNFKLDQTTVADTSAPSTPANFAASNISQNSLNLSWSMSTDNIGVVGYRIYRNGSMIATATGLSHTVSGLTAATNYTFAIQAIDAAQNLSVQSPNISVTTLAAPDVTAPSVPSGLASNTISTNSFNLTWNASSDNVGVLSYKISEASSKFAEIIVTHPTLNRSITGLSASTAYSVRIKACDAAGNCSADSANLVVSTLNPPDTTAPSVPLNLASSAITATSFSLAWSASSDNIAVTSYKVSEANNKFAEMTVVANSASISNLTASSSYSVRVRACDAANNCSAVSSNLAVSTTAVPDTVAPSVPSNLASNTIGSTSFNLAWTASTDNVRVASYKVSEANNKFAELTVTTNSATVSSLTASTAYSVRVRACDGSNNCSANTVNLAVSTIAAADVTPPSVPAGLASSNVAITTAMLVWSAATDNVAVTKYQIQTNSAGTPVDVNAPALSLNLSNLTAATAYQYRIRACDQANNCSAYSANISFTTQAAADTTAPSVPANLASASISSTSFNLNWSASTDNVAVANYKVSEANNKFAEITVTTNSRAISGLTASTAYSVRVKACDAANNCSANTANLAVTTTAPDSAPVWTVPSGAIPTTSAFYPLLSAVDATTKESYRVLYHWLAQYTVANFTLPKSPISYNANFMANDDNAFKIWSLFSNAGRNLADPVILQLQPDKFLSSTTDVGGKFKIQRDSNYVLAEPIAGAWHYSWDYPGNPNYKLPQLMHRAFAHAIPAMVWTDNSNHQNQNMRTDFLGGSTIRYAVPYSLGKNLLPIQVQQAYEQILIKMFNRLNTWNLVTTFGDMEIQAAVGMYYIAKALNNPVYYSLAATRAEFIFEKMISGAGFEKHENGADVVYQGIAQYFMVWLYSATQTDPQATSLYEWLGDYVDRSCKFINYMTYLEPGPVSSQKRVIGPSHFNAANGGALRTFIWGSGLKSFLAGGFYSNHCRTLLHNQINDSYHHYPLTTTPAQMRTDMQSFLSSGNYVNQVGTDCKNNDKWSVTCNNPAAPLSDAAENHWTTDTSFAYNYSYYKPGYYQELMNDIANNAEWNKFPHQYSYNYIEELEDINEPNAGYKPWFVVGKSSSLHTIWHLGTLAWRNSNTNIAGFGGGALSSVATVAPIIMGSERGNQDQAFTIDDWRLWPTHHMAGLDSSGKYFGNARDRSLTRSVSRNGNTSVNAIVNGTIDASSNSYTNPGGNITGMTYERQLGFSQSGGVTVSGKLMSNGTKQASELYEIIPVYLYYELYNNCTTAPTECTTISFRVNGAWVTPSTSYTANVTDIRLSRYNAPLYIHFPTPQRVKLSPSEVTLVRETRHHRNLMIDLLGNNGNVVNIPATVQFNYTINTTSP
jgi:chitodextrinase